MSDNLERFKGQYIKDDGKSKKSKAHKGNELHNVNLCTYSHNGKTPHKGGAI